MGTRTITFSLDVKSIDRAIKELERYREEFKAKCERLRQRVGEHIRLTAERNFSYAMVSDMVYGAPPPNDVEVTMEDSGNVTTVIASGNEALFIEFGAGVYHNGPVGTSPHPWGTYTIGSYGKGNGRKNAWGYYSGGELYITRGTPSSAPMYRAMQDAMRVFDSLVQEVFG